MVFEAKMKQSLKQTLKKTDVWKQDALLFKLNGSGINNAERRSSRLSNSPSLLKNTTHSRKSRLSQNSKDLKGHIPIQTMRDKDVFSQVSGVSQTVTNFAVNTLNSIVKRSSTTDPLSNEQDSLFDRNLIGGAAELLEKASIDSQINIRPAPSLPNPMASTVQARAAERPFVQRLKMKESQPDYVSSNSRQNEVDSVLSIAEVTNNPVQNTTLNTFVGGSFAGPRISTRPALKGKTGGRLDMVHTAAQNTVRRKQVGMNPLGDAELLSKVIPESQDGPRHTKNQLYRGKLIDNITMANRKNYPR